MKRIKPPLQEPGTGKPLGALGLVSFGLGSWKMGAWGLVLSGVLLLTLGCGPGAPPAADKPRALSALRMALQSWKSGEPPDSLKNTLSIQMVDPAWERGSKLEKFEIDETSAQPSGFDLGVPVKLWFENSGGSAKTIKYTVSTSPALVITRDFGGQ